jgi:hypothetical protein
VVLVEVPRRAPMALLGQPAAARIATSRSAGDKLCQLDVIFVARDDVFIDNVPSAIRCGSKRSGDNREPRFSTSV